MNAEVKQKWIEALRSGDYTQCKNFLCRRSDNGIRQEHCCLGVLTDLYIQDTGCGEWKTKGLDIYQFESPVEVIADYLPQEVIRWAKIECEGIKNNVPFAGEYPLPYLNDNKGYTFVEIADLIEEHL